MPKITINGKEIEVKAGITLLQAAKSAGVEIPHYCYHPHLSIAGNCRMCLVEIEKMPKLQISCNTFVTDGMVVRTDSEKVKNAVRGVLEFILINHPIDCPVCDQAGECGLQDYYMEYGLHDSRISVEDKVRKKKVVDLGPLVVLDKERCILCSRCVRFCQEISKTNELQFFGRNDHVEIGTKDNKPLQFGYSGNVVDICPVGALTSKDFRFKQRVWFLSSTPSICPLCSTGCNIFIDHKDGVIYRLRPRRNDEVNQSWICDEGRMGYKSTNDETRLREPLIKKDGKLVPCTWDEAYEEIIKRMDEISNKYGNKDIAGIASAQKTNEELFLFKKYIVDVLGSENLDFRFDNGYKSCGVREDDILRRVDKNPNTRGALNLGIALNTEKSIDTILDGALNGTIKVIYCIGQEIFYKYPGKEKLKKAFSSLDFFVLHATHFLEEVSFASILLPTAMPAETEGTFTNYEGRVQKINKAFPPPLEAKAGWEIFLELLKRKGKKISAEKPEDIFSFIAKEVTSYSGLSYGKIGKLGIKP